MATTSPDNIWTPDAGDAYALTTDLAAMADTVQDALTTNITLDRQQTFWGPAADKGGAATASKKIGDRYQDSDGSRILHEWDGTNWIALQGAFTPVFAGLTLGNGARGGEFWRSPGKVEIFAWFRMGSTSSVGSGLKLTLPVPPALVTGSNPHEVVGLASANRPGNFFAPLSAIVTSATAPELEILAITASGAYATYTGVTSSIPGSWGDGTVFSVRGSYRVAS